MPPPHPQSGVWVSCRPGASQTSASPRGLAWVGSPALKLSLGLAKPGLSGGSVFLRVPPSLGGLDGRQGPAAGHLPGN